VQGWFAFYRGDDAGAIELWLRALEAYEQLDLRINALDVHHLIAWAAIETGDPNTARCHSTLAHELAVEMSSRLFVARARSLLGVCDLLVGSTDTGVRLLRRALNDVVRDEDLGWTPWLLGHLIGEIVAAGRWQEAARLLGAHDHIVERVGARLPATTDRRMRRLREQVSAALGESDWVRLHEAGVGPDADGVIELVDAALAAANADR
jgi:hypothetical protein